MPGIELPGNGIVDMISERGPAAGDIVRGDHAAPGGMPAKRHATGSDEANGPAAQRQRTYGQAAEGKESNAGPAKRKDPDAQAARGDAAHGNSASCIQYAIRPFATGNPADGRRDFFPGFPYPAK